jgi:geranylgeranyl diphosphate/geranylgeranyl-bacteriochlorophyllide a reductase
MYDIAIVGAGPAGATLARLIPADKRVLLVDRRQLDRDPAECTLKKPCGGLLAPAAQKELARQGLGIPASVVAGPQLFAVRTLDLTAHLERLYQRFYINIDREAFDRWLVSLVPSNVETCFGWNLTHMEPDADAPTLTFRTAEGGRASIRAKLVVGADGALSSVRRFAFPDDPRPAMYHSVQATYDLVSAEPSYGAIFDAELTDYYGWTIPKAGQLLVGAAFPAGPGVSARFDEFVNRLGANGFRLGREVSRSACAIARPTAPGQLLVGRGRVVLAGEAAGFISPSSAEGISYALRCGADLAHALEPGIDGVAKRYLAAAWPQAIRVGVKAAKAGAIYGPATRRLVMRSGIGAISAQPGMVSTPQLAGNR